MVASQHAPTAPRERLLWVRLPSTRVFWPACVYDEYDVATAHNHDLSEVRANKPTPDMEDRVVFFFGVRRSVATGANAGIATQPTVVPSRRLCVVHKDEIKTHVWDGADDFGNVCRTHHISDEAIARAEQNSAFVHACEDATRFYEEAHNDDDASRLFMAFLTARKKRAIPQQMHSTVAVSRPLPSTLALVAPVQEKRKEDMVEIKAPIAKAPKQAETTAQSTKTKLPKELPVLCWPLMEAGGWTTFVKPDGGKIYAMPGVQFFQFRPNETVFDSLEDACLKFLQRWPQEEDGDANQLHDCFLEMMVASGWQTIASADQVVYVMPNTPFDRFIPNETIFQSKQTAIAKFLCSLGVDEQGEPELESEAEASDSEAAISSADESEHETSEVDEGSSSDVEVSDVEMSDAETVVIEDEHSDDDRTASTPAVRVLRPTAEKKKANVKPRPTRKAKKEVQRTVTPVVPPFKLRQGHVEAEIRSRGWFWKAVGVKRSPDGYIFYKPHCEDKDEEEVQVGRDCFAGYLSLEAYLKSSEPEIIDKLRQDHEQAYTGANTPASKVVQNIVRKQPTKRSPPVDVIVIEDDEADTTTGPATRESTSSGASRRKPAQDQIKRYRAPRISVQDIKFGDVWRLLAERGWFYRPGQFEYDYVKPTARTMKKQDMVRGQDYFTSRDELEDYLKESGLWIDIANEIRRDVEEDEDTDEGHTTPVKRKRSETERADTSRTSAASKKVKTGTSESVQFFTPPSTQRAKKVPVSVSTNHDELEATQDLTTLTDASSRISPESTSSKSRSEEAMPEGSQLARNLNHAFTPSPSADKKVTKPQESPLSPLELAEQSITRLSLAHQPSTFAHREMETKKIEEFCRACFAEERGGSLYLSGSPGCGKSALLRYLSNQLGQLHKEYGLAPNSIVPVHVNAMGMKDFNQVYRQVAETLTNTAFTDGEAAFEAIERETNTGLPRSKTIFLILDEIDALGKTSLESELCRLFELAHRPGHSFILVGVANQIDFTERHLASLRLQLPNVKPQVIVFKPYSFQTINEILVDRLGGASSAARIVNAHGLSFIARKVAAQSGDVRLALDICRRVLQQKVGELAANGATDFGSPISLIDIVKIIKVVLEGKSKSNVLSLPRNLQMILFATTRLVAQASYVASTSSPTPTDDSSTTHKLYHVDDLYDCYCDVSHDAGVFKPLTRSEFKLGLETLSSEGMIGAHELKKQLLKLLTTPSELLQTFKNDAYFARLL